MSVLAQLYRHNRWANLTLLDYCVPLGQEQLIAQAPGAHPFGAYGSLVHLVLNEEGYYETVTSGRNQIADPRIASLYEVIREVTQGPIWSPRRWRAWDLASTSAG